MFFQFLIAVGTAQHDYSWLNALVDEALSVWRRHHNDTGQTFFRKAINAVVVVFVVHPKLKAIKFTRCVLRCLQLQFDWRITEDHVKLQLDDGASERCEIWR